VTAQSVRVELQAAEEVEEGAPGPDAVAFASWSATRDGSPLGRALER
jgi:hypothetical protein